MAVVGPSGSGKSTLLRVLAGLQRPTSGTVQIDGEPIARPSWRSAGDPRVTLIHQDYRLVAYLSVEENLRLTAEVRNLPVTASTIHEALLRVGLEHLAYSRLPSTLSGGEQQRLAIARALVCSASVLLADEPTGALDSENTIRVAEVLGDIGRQAGVTVVIATHDPLVAAAVDRVYHLRHGTVNEA
ncbi:putative ABC transporter, ATP-binding protein [metagenome]|uniref:Putative ABC transporter, ATP-binding protein n=1 Tax=metagenome TaxID=256318 RepID=A0A2P2C6J6_9ZZZZ